MKLLRALTMLIALVSLARGASAAEPEAHVQPLAKPTPPAAWRWMGGLPFSIGAGFYSTKEGLERGPWLRFRFELLQRREPVAGDGFTFALGGYAEGAWHDVTDELRFAPGAGITGAVWLSPPLALRPSLGVYYQEYGARGGESGVTAGLSFGHAAREGALTLPFGLRLDMRTGLGSIHEHALLVGVEAESLVVVLAPAALLLLPVLGWQKHG